MKMIRPWSIGALGAVALLSAACSKKDNGTDTVTTSSGAIAVVPDTTPKAVAVSEVLVGRAIGADKKVTNEADKLGPKDTIFASVHTTGNQTANLTARWNFENGKVVDEHSQSISPKGDAYTEFHIVSPKGLAVGKYTIHVLIDGKEASTKDFKIEK